MSRPVNADPPTLPPPMAAALSKALASVNQLLDHTDPKVALRAVAELSKLLAVCGRHGWSEEVAKETFPPGPLSEVERGCSTPPQPDLPRPAGERATVPAPRRISTNQEPHRLEQPLYGPAGGPAGEAHHRLPLGGPSLTSFLGTAIPPRKPPGPTNSV